MTSNKNPLAEPQKGTSQGGTKSGSPPGHASERKRSRNFLWLAFATVLFVAAVWGWGVFGNRRAAEAAHDAALTGENQSLPSSPRAGEIHSSTVDGMEMVYIPAGTFLMGSAEGREDAQPVHAVSLDAYWMDRTEVTNAMYATCVDAGYCDPPHRDVSLTRLDGYFRVAAFADHPVLFVDWSDAQTYCAWAGRRLPTEAEWERAARGEDGRTYPWGHDTPSCSLANFHGCEGDTAAVGSRPDGASPYGLYDMAGNVWEWVADWYQPGYGTSSPVSNPAGPSRGEGRVVRGGSWDYGSASLQAASRNYFGARSANYYLGFRCVR